MPATNPAIHTIAATPIPTLATRRLVLSVFHETDIPALAAILRVPEVGRGIMANGATTARARQAAAQRIRWHNATWPSHGYGIWALRLARGDDGTTDELAARRKLKRTGRAPLPQGALIGWCGFTRPEIGTDPELLYGLHPAWWQQGLAAEAAGAALAWLFATTRHQGTAAVIFPRINPASTTLIQLLGFERKGRLAIADFATDRALARDIIAYETWRLGKAKASDSIRLIFEAPFKAGQLASLFPEERHRIADALRTAASGRRDLPDLDPAECMLRVRAAFEEGLGQPWLDWWRKGR